MTLSLAADDYLLRPLDPTDAVARADGSAHEFGIFGRDGHRYVGAAGLNQFNRIDRFCNLGYWVRASDRRQGAGGWRPSMNAWRPIVSTCMDGPSRHMSCRWCRPPGTIE